MIIGKTVVSVSHMNEYEMEREGWDHYSPTTVIEFDDGTKIFASSDEEGNGPGCMFGYTPGGDSIYITPEITY